MFAENFTECAMQMEEANRSKEFEMIFRQVDEDDSGTVSVREILSIEEFAALSEDKLKEILSEVDADHNGTLGGGL